MAFMIKQVALLLFCLQPVSADINLRAMISSDRQVDAPPDTGSSKRSHHDAVDVVHQPGFSSDPVKVPFMAFPLAFGLVGGIILFIYGPRGYKVVLSVLIYVAALSSMKLTVKWVFATHNYPFAAFVSSLHFLAGAIATGAVLLNRGSIPVPSVQEFFYMIVPIAVSVAASIGANNIALTFVTAGFTEIIGATGCLTTILMVILMGMPFNKMLVLPAMVVVFGCGMAVQGEMHFSLWGMALCILANVFRSTKVALQQKLMTGETKDKFDPCALLFWISLPSVVVMAAFSLMKEGLEPYRSLASVEAGALPGLLVAILASAVNATILNLAQLFVTKDLGAVGSQLVAQAKMILTVLGGMVIFGEEMSALEVVGFGLALVGVFTYSRMEQAFKAQDASEKKPILETKATTFGSELNTMKKLAV